MKRGVGVGVALLAVTIVGCGPKPAAALRPASSQGQQQADVCLAQGMQVVLDDIHGGTLNASTDSGAAEAVQIMTDGFENCLRADGWTCDDRRDECSTSADVVHVSSSVNSYLTRYSQIVQQWKQAHGG